MAAFFVARRHVMLTLPAGRIIALQGEIRMRPTNESPDRSSAALRSVISLIRFARSAVARRERLRRADQIVELAERLACSPVATALSSLDVDTFVRTIHETAETMVAERERRRAAALAEPKEGSSS